MSRASLMLPCSEAPSLSHYRGITWRTHLILPSLAPGTLLIGGSLESALAQSFNKHKVSAVHLALCWAPKTPGFCAHQLAI